ncbi:ATP/GTP-binding protein [Desulfosporosinus sp. BICA1-9]|uniref:AAA family ATPase n=1 Tax=Desulfosporosinus sp. BICA1-9 TaxID=1531958 RepID=UPI00054C216F|nr:ATP-binding protein [Desulfosporosinus sp. BICA1-9]KJS89638.1 MAG: abortive infection protein [Desulfosporosinus sp. BICA1-9]
MLCQFTFENFKSFKNEATLDLCAEKISEHEDSLIVDPRDSEKFLPVISIYGPNGGGKSSVLEAFVYLSHKVLLPVIALKALTASKDENLEDGKMKEFRSFPVDEKEKYYLFDKNCRELPIKFDVLFRINETEYRYQLNILHSNIVEENLYARNLQTGDLEIMFERDTSDFYIADVLGEVKVGNIKSSIPLLSHLSINYDIKTIDNVITWFLECRVLDYDNPFQDKKIVFLKDKSKEDIFLKMLAEMDINITSIRTEEDTNGKITAVYTTHCLEDGACEELPFEEESSGTRKLFGLLPFLLGCLHKGSLVIADEMDAKLHPKLLRYIIALFTNPSINTKGAQLIFTSHDMSTMKPTVFRRDEIWFSALNKKNTSKLYSLVEFRKDNGAKVRPDETYDKQYIEGRYGADPYLKNILDWGTVQ